MKWLDAELGEDPGRTRGSCSGDQIDFDSQEAHDAYVTFANVRYGEIGSTVPDCATSTTTADSTSTTTASSSTSTTPSSDVYVDLKFDANSLTSNLGHWVAVAGGVGSKQIRMMDINSNEAGKVVFQLGWDDDAFQKVTSWSNKYSLSTDWTCYEWHMDSTAQTFDFYVSGNPVAWDSPQNIGSNVPSGRELPQALDWIGFGVESLEVLRQPLVEVLTTYLLQQHELDADLLQELSIRQRLPPLHRLPQQLRRPVSLLSQPPQPQLVVSSQQNAIKLSTTSLIRLMISLLASSNKLLE